MSMLSVSTETTGQEWANAHDTAQRMQGAGGGGGRRGKRGANS